MRSFSKLWFVLWLALVGIGSMSFAQASFPDIEDHQYSESILFLQVREVVKGYPDGSFGPDRGVTRAEMLKIILASSLEEGVLGSGSNCFIDVLQQRHAPYVCYAKEHDIVKGYPGNVFKPDQQVTVAEGLKIALETFDMSVDEGSGVHRYAPYVDFVHIHNLFSKYALRPDMPMTRGQMSYLVHQLLLEKENVISFAGRRDSASPGCEERSAPRTAPTSSVVDGLTRHYITTVGRNYKHNRPTKLIFAFHGRTNSNTQVRSYYKLEKAYDGDAIIIYPSGLPEGGPSRSRGGASGPNGEIRDVALFDVLVKEFSENYCIDMDEIYAVGHSLGAWFTNSLACTRGDVLRGIGSVGGATTLGECSGPVAAIIMQHPEDTFSSYAAGVTARDQLLSQNGCGPETKPVGPAEGNCLEYTNCTDSAPVVRCPHSDSTAYNGTYYPHTWPNFAGKEIWNFFDGQ